jgi:hypothetical protein
MGYKGRDVEINILDNDFCLVAACDSCGAIGDKELDQVRVPAFMVGQLTCRAVLLEVISTNAIPKIMTVAISSELDPTGNNILDGVHAELKASDLIHLPLAISTEKNFKTSQTGLGISVTGVCKIKDLKIAKSQPGDRVYCLGLPKVGKEILDTDDSLVINAGKITMLLKQKDVHDILPVGSQGIRLEVDNLALNTGSIFKSHDKPLPDLDKSAGPSTCIIFTSARKQDKTNFEPLPLYEVGIFISN